MKNVHKSAEPASLVAFNDKNRVNDWSLIHSGNHRNVYDDCVLQCMEDQDYLCGYTETKLDDNCHIDHFVKRDIDPTKTFDWNNMIAAVHDSRYGADYKDSIVGRNDYDYAKRKYHHVLSPVLDEMAGRFRFSTNGCIEPVGQDDKDAEETIRVFNLNEQSLCQRRKQTMKAVRDMLQMMTKDEVAEYMKNEEFASAIAFELSVG